MRIQDGFQASPIRSTGDPLQPCVELSSPAREDHAGDGQCQGDGDETHDEGAEIGSNERIEVDPEVLRWGNPSIAGGPSRESVVVDPAGYGWYPLPSKAGCPMTETP